jgi:hypothetical protein
MTLQDLANLGEFLAAVGVLISLLYLAAQIRQNTQSLRAQTYHALTAESLAVLRAGWAGGDVPSFWLRLQSGEALMPEDQFRLRTLSLSIWRLFDDLLYQHRVGTLEEDLWHGYERVYLEYLHIPLLGEWLAKNEAFFSAALREWRQKQQRFLSDRDQAHRSSGPESSERRLEPGPPSASS